MKQRIFRGIATALVITKVQRKFLLFLIEIFAIMVMCGLFAGAAQAAKTTKLPTVAYQNGTDGADVEVYQRMAMDYLEKQGWKPDKTWGYRYWGITKAEDRETRRKLMNLPSDDELRADYEREKAANKSAGLPGYGYAEADLAHFWMEYRDNGLRYSFLFYFKGDKGDGKDVALVGGYSEAENAYGNVLAFQPLNTKASKLIQKAEASSPKVTKAKKATPVDDIAALDFLPAKLANDQTSKLIVSIFQDEGWSKTKFNVFYETLSWSEEKFFSPAGEDKEPNAPDISLFDILSEDEWFLAFEATGQMKNTEKYSSAPKGEEWAYCGTFYREKKYKIDDAYYYLDFFAVFEAAKYTKYYDAPDLMALFLVAKPAKPNAEGKLDHFFYPPDAKSSVIAADMRDYFNGKEPSRCVK